MNNVIDFNRLKQLDEYAKSLGITIYTLKYGFVYDNELKEHYIEPFNVSPDYEKDYPNAKGLVQCL